MRPSSDPLAQSSAVPGAEGPLHQCVKNKTLFKTIATVERAQTQLLQTQRDKRVHSDSTDIH